jgi:hypothetical protein
MGQDPEGKGTGPFFCLARAGFGKEGDGGNVRNFGVVPFVDRDRLPWRTLREETSGKTEVRRLLHNH